MYSNLIFYLLRAGFNILENSKLFMVQSFYKLKERLSTNERMHVITSDTDSFLLRLSNITSREFFKKNADMMDFSNYPVHDPLFTTAHKQEARFFKDELAGT